MEKVSVREVRRKLRLGSVDEAVRMQLVFELGFLGGETVSEYDMKVLCELGKSGEVKMGDFCNKAGDKLGKGAQDCRNRVGKMIKKGMVMRDGGKIRLSVGVESDGDFLLNYQLLMKEDKS